jgi:hypothetical protein
MFWHCSFRRFLIRTVAEAPSGNEPSRVLAQNRASKGSGMLIRSEMQGIHGKTAVSTAPEAIPAASFSALLPDGLLLLICP